MEATAIIDVLSRALSGDAGRVEPVSSGDGMPTLYVAPEHLVDVCLVLRDAPELRFVLLLDLIPVDYHPRVPRYEVVYLLACPGVGGYGESPKRLRLKVRVPAAADGDGQLPSVAGIWASANWAEREAFDFFGLRFDGHPDLRRVLMPEDWEGYPLRKDYPVQIKERVKTYAPLQVSEEEFVANVESARTRARKG